VADQAAGAALEARGLVKRYGPAVALASIDLQVPRGSITALVGPNGAGKSTLIKAWMAFERPSEGSVLVWGEDPWVNRRRAVGMIGYVPQSPALYRDLSVEDHLDLARSLRPRFDAELARSRLDRLGIRPGARPGQLSGGEQAQVGLAIALGTRAPILILDEPLANLDPLARRDFLAVMLETIQRDSGTVVLSSHIITDVEAVCDRLVVLNRGTKLLDATIEDIAARHFVLSETWATSLAGFVSSFEDRAGQSLYLVRHDEPEQVDTARPATLEEVVIGYLSGAKRSTP
jgi:ABC-2 type transport system ATP-binding protein